MKIKKITPMFTSIVTSMNKYEGDILNDGILDTSKQEGSLKEYQTVVAIGSAVRDIKVGDVVYINPERFAVKQHNKGSLKDGVITDNPTIKYNFNVVEIDEAPCLLLQDRDIEFIINEFEIEDSNIIYN